MIPTDSFRIRTYAGLLQKGCDRRTAALGSVGIHFLHDDAPPGDRSFEKLARKVSRRTAKASRKTPTAELNDLFRTALEELYALSVSSNQGFYAEQARAQLEFERDATR